jgi:NAD(P)-dependent dehydrogenase (short-subunit alcohol dehydrogenase family)
MESNNFKGKVAFVTGAANGIGRATAIAFALEGASVVVADISEQGSHETTNIIKEAGERALPVKCDVSQTEDVKSCQSRASTATSNLL